MAHRPPSTLRAWMQLLRPPNLFTVPGDPLAGYLLANAGNAGSSALAAIGASLFLYSAGLVLNDLADVAEDRRERPGRPIPSGAVSERPAWLFAAVLAVAGLACAWLTGSRASFVAAVALLAVVALYDFLLKRWAVPGAFSMGLCRSLSVIVGALAGPVPVSLSANTAALDFAAVIGLYIAAVANLARYETRAAVPFTTRLWPATTLIIGCLAGLWLAFSSLDRRWAAVFLLLAIAGAARLAIRLFQKEKAPLPPLIGAHIRLLLVLQAAACFLADPYVWGLPSALVLVLLWPVSWKVSRWFYAS